MHSLRPRRWSSFILSRNDRHSNVQQRKPILSFPLKGVPKSWSDKVFVDDVGQSTFFAFASEKGDTRFELVLYRLNNDTPYKLIGRVMLFAGDVATIRRSSTLLTKIMDQTFGCLLCPISSLSQHKGPSWGRCSFHIYGQPYTLVEDLHVVLEQLLQELSVSGLVDTCSISTVVAK